MPDLFRHPRSPQGLWAAHPAQRSTPDLFRGDGSVGRDGVWLKVRRAGLGATFRGTLDPPSPGRAFFSPPPSCRTCSGIHGRPRACGLRTRHSGGPRNKSGVTAALGAMGCGSRFAARTWSGVHGCPGACGLHTRHNGGPRTKSGVTVAWVAMRFGSRFAARASARLSGGPLIHQARGEGSSCLPRHAGLGPASTAAPGLAGCIPGTTVAPGPSPG